MSENAAASTISQTTAWVETASKVGALSIAVVYGVGYLVSSIHLASLGMVLSDPFRPKIAAAGVLFAVLFAIPVWAAYETTTKLDAPIAGLQPGEFPVAMFRTAHIYHIAFLIAIPMQLIFAPTDTSMGWQLYLVVGLIAIESAAFATLSISKRFDLVIRSHPGVSLSFYFFLNVVYVAVTMSVLRPGRFTFFGVIAWLYGVGIFIMALGIGKPRLPGFIQQTMAQFLLPIYFFATFVYPHIKAEWGGGQAVDVIVRFTKDSPISASQTIKLQLVDDTDTGIYVLQQTKKHVLFIPRTDVALISYSNDLSDLPQH